MVEAARGKQIFYFPARHDHWLVQTGDGWSAHVAGAIGVSTDAQASWWGGRGIGTVPHGLIAAYGGDTVEGGAEVRRPLPRRHEHHRAGRLRQRLGADRARGRRGARAKLWGVRLDTSELLVDRSLWDEMGGFKPTGVNPRLVEKVRGALDGAGFPDVRIVVSGGFNAERIREFEATGVPVDAYGVGSSLIRGQNDFTADVVLLDGQPCAKVGRAYAPNPRLERVTSVQSAQATRRRPAPARRRVADRPERPDILGGAMLSAIDHVGVAVASIDDALALYRDTLGMPLVHRETVTEQGVDAALLDVGDSHVELLQPLGPDTAVGKFLSRRGPGLHHVAYRVTSVQDTLDAAPPRACG